MAHAAMATTPDDAARRRAWLVAAAAPAGGRGRLAAGLLLLDGIAAIGFAAALARGLTALPGGLAAAAPWLALGLLAAATRGATAMLRARAGAAASAVVRTALRHRMVVACLGLPPGARRPAGELMAVAVDAVEALDGYVARFLPARRAAGVVPLVILAVVTLASPVCAALLLATLLPFVVMMILAGGAAADEARRQLVALARLSGLFADRVRALPVILAFQAEADEADRLGEAAEELRRRAMGVLRVAFLSSAGLELFAALSVAMVAVYAGFSLLHLLPFPAPEQLGLGAALFALALAPEFYLPLRRLAAAYHERQAAEAAAGELMALGVSACRPPCAALRLTAAPRLRFEGVGICYPGEDRAVVDDLELDVPAGAIAVLLGPSGCGKTSVLNLLLGLAPLSGGEVWIGDAALSQIGSVAESVAWVGQSPVILPGSLAENIALARRDASPADIARAAAQAGLHGGRFATLETLLDERGGGLSGGERRRIAIARALLKPSAILLLDEPTAHLDAAAEAELIAVIRRAARGRTTLIATHSAALAALGDVVLRLGQGA